MARGTEAVIDVAALARNLDRVRGWAGEARVMAVVKADAYGHGLERCLPALVEADLLAVATLDEARAIRALDPRTPVLLLEGVMAAEELPVVDALALEMVVHSPEQLHWIEAAGGSPGPRVWLKLDSGMHRLGFALEAAEAAYRRLHALPGVETVVLMTHFACADDPEGAMTDHQLAAFDAAVAGLDGPHCVANSAALLTRPGARRDWVRAGLLPYGVSPLADRDGPELGLDPVMTLESRLISVRDVPAGDAVGYGARYRAARDVRIGVAAIGYGDGYPRNLPDGTPVLVNGRRQALAGRVSMDMATVDLAGQPDAAVGDPVVLWGRGLPVEEIARAAGTIPYELVCRVTRRVRYREIPYLRSAARS
ncbi:alanine racemase [Wenzhouxiangella sp. XN79A]|uniref:alanine racemase n=1 Tax=Wenzhouxiangella sp. XN79A TaxID=2724193 RepID=UPI00144A83A5|nr:alanine racemase [Wenzhouxiangella sp. XN79A]NKI34107.1 alanine racemase [Wenzhouxiangella sp. XN79A]